MQALDEVGDEFSESDGGFLEVVRLGLINLSRLLDKARAFARHGRSECDSVA